MSLSFQLSFFVLLRYPGQWNHWWNIMLMLLVDNKSSSVRTFRQNHLLLARKHWSSRNISYAMQSGTEFGNKTKEDIRILIRYSELKDFSPVTFKRQYSVLLPVWQGDEVFILRSFVTRKVSLLKLLQHNLAVLEKIMAQITTIFRGKFLNK